MGTPKMKGRVYLPESKVLAPDPKVVANPTDPYASPGDPSRAGSIVDAMNTFVNSGTLIVAAKAKEVRQEGEDEGLTAQANEEGTGKVAPAYNGLFNEAYTSGYYKIDGEYRASQYHLEASKYTKDNKDLMEQDEFYEGLNEIRAKYSAGIVHTEQKKAFLPKAAEVDDAINLAFSETKRKQIHGVTLEKAAFNARTSQEEILTSVLQKRNLMSKEALLGEEGLKVWAAEGVQIAQELAPLLQADHKRFVESNRDSLSRSEATEIWVENIMMAASSVNRGEFLRGLFLKGPDNSPAIIDLNDTKGNPIGMKVQNLIETLQGRSLTQSKELKNRIKEDKEEAGRVIAMDLYGRTAKIRAMTSPEERTAGMVQYEADVIALASNRDVILTHGQYADIVTTMRTLQATGTDYHPPKTRDEDAREFYFRKAIGTATVAFVHENRGKYDVGDLEKFFAMAGEQQNSKSKGGEGEVYFTEGKMIAEEYKSIIPLYNPKGSAGRIYDRRGRDKAEAAEAMFRERIADYTEKYKKNPDRAFRKALMEEIRTTPGLEPYVRSKPAEITANVDKMLADGRLPRTIPQDRGKWIETNIGNFITGPEVEAMEAYMGGPKDLHRAGAVRPEEKPAIGSPQKGK